jgi:hypothetical protein
MISELPFQERYSRELPVKSISMDFTLYILSLTVYVEHRIGAVANYIDTFSGFWDG